MSQSNKDYMMVFLILLINLIYPSALRTLETLNAMKRIEALGPIDMVFNKKKGRKVPYTTPEEAIVVKEIIAELAAYIEAITGIVIVPEKMFSAIEKMREHSHWNYKFNTVNKSLAKDVWSADHLGFGFLIFYGAFEEPEKAHKMLLGPKRLCQFPHRLVRAPTLKDYEGDQGQKLDYMKVYDCLQAVVKDSPPPPSPKAITAKKRSGRKGKATEPVSSPKPPANAIKQSAQKEAAPKAPKTKHRNKGKRVPQVQVKSNLYQKQFNACVKPKTLRQLLKQGVVGVKKEEIKEEEAGASSSVPADDLMCTETLSQSNTDTMHTHAQPHSVQLEIKPEFTHPELEGFTLDSDITDGFTDDMSSLLEDDSLFAEGGVTECEESTQVQVVQSRMYTASPQEAPSMDTLLDFDTPMDFGFENTEFDPMLFPSLDVIGLWA